MSSAETVPYPPVAQRVDEAQLIGVDDSDVCIEELRVRVRDPWTAGDTANSRVTWGEEHGLHPDFLPFAYLKLNPLDILIKVRAHLRSRPKTRQRVSTSELYSQADLETSYAAAISLEDICLLEGWWKGGESSSTGPYFCNPEYPHSHGDDHIHNHVYWDSEIDDYVCERFELAARAARLGLSSRHIAPAFGLNDPDAVASWCLSNGFVWEVKRREGNHRLARTWATLSKWGYTHRRIGELFDTPESTVSNRMNRVCSDWDAPADPSYVVIA